MGKVRRARTKKFNKFYDEISHNWQEKARKLQERRWRRVKRAMKEGRNPVYQ